MRKARRVNTRFRIVGMSSKKRPQRAQRKIPPCQADQAKELGDERLKHSLRGDRAHAGNQNLRKELILMHESLLKVPKGGDQIEPA